MERQGDFSPVFYALFHRPAGTWGFSPFRGEKTQRVIPAGGRQVLRTEQRKERNVIKVKIEGMQATLAMLKNQQKQVRYAASRAINNVAFAVNAEIKEDMQRVFKGGATTYTLRAFRVDKATRDNLTAIVRLRDDAPEGGTSYTKALRHLFTSGTRQWKKVEGLLRGIKAIPDGMMAVPGSAARLDRRGNMYLSDLREIFGVLKSSIRNTRVFRHTGRGKRAKHVGYFVVLPVSPTKLHQGIWKRIETGSSSVVQPMIMYVKRGQYKQFIDLQRIGQQVVGKRWQQEFERELAVAMRNAR